MKCSKILKRKLNNNEVGHKYLLRQIMSLLEKQKITEDFVRNQSKIHFGIPYEISSQHFLHSFGTHFGTKPSIVKLLYNEWVRTGTVPEKYKVLYLLWALYFLRSNETDLKLSAAFGYSVMT